MHTFDPFQANSREPKLAPQFASLDSPDPLFDAFDREPPCRPAALPRPRLARRERRESLQPALGLGSTQLGLAETPLGIAADSGARTIISLLVLALLAANSAACAREESAPIARDAVLVQLHEASRLPDWSRPDSDPNGPAILPLSSISSDESAPLFRVPVPAGEEPAAFASLLARDPAVEFAEPIALMQPLSRTPDDPRFPDQWGLAEINAPAAWETTVGDRAIAVAVIDDGLALTHGDLAANLWTNPGEVAGNGLDDDEDGIVDDVHGASFLGGIASGDPSPDLSAAAPWHGTHAAGIIGAVGDNRLGVSGVAWRVSLMGIRTVGASGGRSDDLAQAIDYASQHGARVINASWGGAQSVAVEQAIVRATRLGAVFVTAAGNDGAAAPTFPADLELPNLLSVGALDVNGALASFSNRGALVAAPGVAILTTSAPGSYERADGTSVAAPHVSGLAALLFAAHPEASAEQVTAAILSSSIALNGVQHGRIDAARALAALAASGGDSPSGLLLSRDALSFTGSSAQLPHAQTISIRSSSGVATSLLATSSESWVHTVHTELTTPTRVTVVADPTSLSPGAHSAEISFTSPDGLSAKLQVAFTVGPRSRATALGAGCSVGSDGLIEIQRGAVCTLLAPGVGEDATAPSIRWTLPDGSSQRGGRMTAIFSRLGGYSIQVGGGGDTSELVLAVE